MPELHAVVCVKVVPKPEEIHVIPETMMLERAGVRSEINPPDMNALEMALRLKDRHGATISILSMGPPNFEPILRVGLAMGCDDIYLLSDQAFAGADTLATTYTLARGVSKIGAPDLIFCGEESSDGATGQVPSGLAEWLGIPQLTLLTEVDVDLARGVGRGRRELKGGYELIEVPLPCVVSVKTAANEPRFMDFRRQTWAFEEANTVIWSSANLETEGAHIGLAGSPTIVSALAEAPSRERKRQFLEGTVQEIAGQLLTLLTETTK